MASHAAETAPPAPCPPTAGPRAGRRRRRLAAAAIVLAAAALLAWRAWPHDEPIPPGSVRLGPERIAQEPDSLGLVSDHQILAYVVQARQAPPPLGAAPQSPRLAGLMRIDLRTGARTPVEPLSSQLRLLGAELGPTQLSPDHKLLLWRSATHWHASSLDGKHDRAWRRDHQTGLPVWKGDSSGWADCRAAPVPSRPAHWLGQWNPPPAGSFITVYPLDANKKPVEQAVREWPGAQPAGSLPDGRILYWQRAWYYGQPSPTFAVSLPDAGPATVSPYPMKLPDAGRALVSLLSLSPDGRKAVAVLRYPGPQPSLLRRFERWLTGHSGHLRPPPPARFLVGPSDGRAWKDMGSFGGYMWTPDSRAVLGYRDGSAWLWSVR